jgi:hypothetical protein
MSKGYKQRAVQHSHMSTGQVIIVCSFLFVATVSLRDIIFLLAGACATAVAFYCYQSRQAEQRNARTRIVVSFEELKRDFPNTMEKVDSVYVNKNYYINNYSRGLYHHVAFEDQLNIIEWVEQVEKRLQEASLKQFEDFQQSLHEGVRPECYELNLDRVAGAGETEVKEASISLYLQDTTELIKHTTAISIRSVEDTQLKEVFNDIKSALKDFFSHTDDSNSCWADLNNQALDKIKKIFISEAEINQRNHNWFGLCMETVNQEVFHLFAKDADMTRRANDLFESEIDTKRLLSYDWDALRDRFIEIRDRLKNFFDEAEKVINNIICRIH